MPHAWALKKKITLSEISQTQKGKCCMIPLLRMTLGRANSQKVGQRFPETEGKGRKESYCLKRQGVFVWHDEKFLKQWLVMVAQQCECDFHLPSLSQPQAGLLGQVCAQWGLKLVLLGKERVFPRHGTDLCHSSFRDRLTSSR